MTEPHRRAGFQGPGRVAAVLAALGLTLLAPFVSLPSASAQDGYIAPVVAAEGTAAVPGQPFTVTGQGWPAGALVVFELNPGGIPLGSTTVDQSGRFSFTFTFPQVAPGVYTITATGGGMQSTTAVTVPGPSGGQAGRPAQQGAGGGRLPVSGSAAVLPLAGLSAAALLGGAALVRVARRRETRAEQG